MIRSVYRTIKSLQGINYAKFPIVIPEIYPDPPTEKDYEVLNVSPNVNNRELVMAFRQQSFFVHPAVSLSVESQRQYSKLVEAYDRIALFRMSQDGVPQPYNNAYYPPETHSKVINEFLRENSFWAPNVHEKYNSLLFVFWVVFGVLHTMLSGSKVLFRNPDL